MPDEFIRKEKRGPTWVFPLALFPLGLGLFLTGGNDIPHGHRSLSWPTVPGVVRVSRLTHNFPVPSQPAITYQYSFQGRPYVGNHIWPGETAMLMPVMSGSAALQIVNRFEEGATVPVSVNPANPVDTALIPGASKACRWMGVFTAFFAASLWAPLGMGRFFRPGRERDQNLQG